MIALVAVTLVGALDPAAVAIARSLPPELTLITAHVPQRLQGQDVQVEWRTPPRAGSTRVMLATATTRAWVPVTIGTTELRPTATRPLPPGHLIEASDVVMERGSGVHAPLSIELVIGASTRSAVAAGAELVRPDLVLPPPLARGTPLSVVVQRGALRVSRPGRLETATRVGELGRVRLDGSRELVRARLVSSRSARLEQETRR